MQIHKNTVLFITLLTSILIFSASAIALQFNPTQILDSRNHPVNFISSDNPALVSIAFNYTLGQGESFTVTSVDATDLYPNGIYSGSDYSRLVPVCTKANNTVSCTVKALTIKTTNNTIDVVVSGRYNGGNGTSIINNATALKVTIDNTRPKVTFLGTSTCNNGQCYIASDKKNKIIITMQDERATFEKANIGFKVGSKLELVDACSGMTCNGSTKITCNDGQKLTLSIRQDMSKDDIGNRINGTSTELICDAAPPTLIEHSVASAVGMDTLVLGKDIVFEYNVTDLASPILNMVIDADSVLAGNVTSQCTKTSIEGTGFICRGVVKPTIDQPGLYEFDVNVQDVVGNVAKESLNLNVLKTTNETANNWKVSGVEQSANEFSRPNLEFERTLFTRVNFQPIGNAEIVSIKPDGNCFATELNKTGLDSDVVSVRLLATQPRSVYLKVALRENNDDRYGKLDNLSYECPVSIVSKKGNYYFSTPEKDNFTVLIKLKDDKNIQQYHQDEINKITKRVETFRTAISTYDKAVYTVDMYCKTCAGLTATNSLLGTTQAALGVIPVTKTAAESMTEVTKAIDTVSLAGMCSELQGVCNFMTCNTKYANEVTKWLDSKVSLGGGTTKNGKESITNFAGYEDVSSSMNPYKSYVVALATMCVPAIVYHVKVYTGIECQYLNCISNDYIQYGQDISTCTQDKEYSECMYFTGGFLDGIPVVSMLRDVTKNVGKMARDPVALVGFAIPLMCKVLDFPGDSVGGGLCVAVQDSLATVTQLKTISAMVTQFTKADSSDPSAQCDAIIKNSKIPLDKQTQVGYDPGYSNYYGMTKIGKGMLLCKNAECTYTEGNMVLNVKPKVKAYDSDGMATSFDYLFYQGNKKISNAQMLTEGMSYENYARQNFITYDPENSNNEIWLREFKDGDKNSPEYQAALAKQRGYGAQIKDADERNAIAASNIAEIENQIAIMQKQRYTQMKAKYGTEIIQYMKDVDAATNTYSQKIIDTQLSLSQYNKYIDDAKNVQKYMNKINALKPGEELSAGDKKRFTKLLSSLDPPLNYKSGSADENTVKIESANKQINDINTKIQELNSKKSDEGDESGSYYSNYDIDAQIKTLNGQKADAEDQLKNINTNNANPITSADNFLGVYNSEDGRKQLESQDTYKNLFQENAVKTLEEQKKTADAAIKKAAKDLRTAEIEEAYEKDFGTPNRAFMSAWGNANAIADMRSMFNLNFALIPEHTLVGRFSDFLIEDVSQPEKAICKAAIKPSKRLGDTVIMNSDGADVFKTGAQVGGRKSGLVNDGTKSYYEYWVEGNVLTSKNDGLTVKIIMINSEDKEIDMTQKILGETQPLSKGVEFTFGRPSAYYFTDEANYDKICMVFGGGPLNVYFDHVQGGNTDRICQKIIAE